MMVCCNNETGNDGIAGRQVMMVMLVLMVM